MLEITCKSNKKRVDRNFQEEKQNDVYMYMTYTLIVARKWWEYIYKTCKLDLI